MQHAFSKRGEARGAADGPVLGGHGEDGREERALAKKEAPGGRTVLRSASVRVLSTDVIG